MDRPEPGPRRARTQDAATVTEVLTAAFHDDPTWAWAFPDPVARPQQYRTVWGLAVAGALRYGWVWLTAGDTAASVWIPPGGTDLSDEQVEELQRVLPEVMGPGAARVLDALEVFDRAHPRDEPHYFLSLLGTDPRHRGRGLGLGLLQENLRLVDAERMPAYLEASNPANVPLYERYGFRPIGSFTLPDDGPQVVTMWRDPAGPA